MRTEAQHRAPQPFELLWPWFYVEDWSDPDSCMDPGGSQMSSFGFDWSLCLWCHSCFLLLCPTPNSLMSSTQLVQLTGSVVQEFWKGPVGTALLCLTISGASAGMTFLGLGDSTSNVLSSPAYLIPQAGMAGAWAQVGLSRRTYKWSPLLESRVVRTLTWIPPTTLWLLRTPPGL